jgi:hypothetical protein
VWLSWRRRGVEARAYRADLYPKGSFLRDLYPRVCRHYLFGILHDTLTERKSLKIIPIDRSPARGDVSLSWQDKQTVRPGRRPAWLHNQAPRRWTVVDGGGNSPNPIDIPCTPAPPHG